MSAWLFIQNTDIKYANKNYLSFCFSQAAATTNISLHCKGDWFLVKGAILPVGCTKPLFRMLSGNENLSQNCHALTNSTRVCLETWSLI